VPNVVEGRRKVESGFSTKKGNAIVKKKFGFATS
jgi:hypothetical protein